MAVSRLWRPGDTPPAEVTHHQDGEEVKYPQQSRLRKAMPTGVNLIMSKKRVKTIRNIHGRPVGKATLDDSGRVTQIEWNDSMDAQVRPETQVYSLRTGERYK